MSRDLAPTIAAAPHVMGGRMSTTAEARLVSIIDEHFRVVWRFLRRLGVPPGDVDDCAQEVMLVATRKLEDIQVGRERAFLLGAAFRIASDARRARRRRREADFESLDDRVDPSLGPEALVDRAKARAVLDEILAGMPMDFRAVFILSEIEELPMAEIAQLLGVPQGTVASRLRRGRKYFVSSRQPCAQGVVAA